MTEEQTAPAPAKKAAPEAEPAQEITVTKKGVLIEDANGNDVYVQPESVKVWLDRGAKLK